MTASADARVTLIPAPAGPPLALLWCKQTFKILPEGELVPIQAEPLTGDPLAGDDGLQLEQNPMDLWPHKEAPDLIVQGSAFAPGRAPTRQMEVAVRAGRVLRRVAVFGRREVSWPGGRPHFETPEPFLELPMTWDRAYGGLDWRVPVTAVQDPITALRLQSDHPGLYPRNPHGKGYLVCHGEVPGMELPNLEDPGDLLTPGRLVTGTPTRWFTQPLPACLDALPPVAFPRCIFFADGCDPWHPGPDDLSLLEVSRGMLPPGFRQLMTNRPLEHGPHPRFFQEAAPGLTLPGLGHGAPVEVRGMHPHRPSVSFTVPTPPRLTLAEAGEARQLRPRLHTLLIRPAQETVSLTFGAHVPLRRTYVPGLHLEIPVTLAVDNQTPIPYQAPVPMRDRIIAAAREEAHA